MQAIQATINAAELPGGCDRVGRLATGTCADLIAPGGDPLTDITELERVSFVLKGGRIVKDVITAEAASGR